MKLQVKNIIAVIISLVVINAASAQQYPNVLTGTFTEKVNAELRLYRTFNNKVQSIGDYRISPDNLDFVIALPADTLSNYSFEVKIMKHGHMRLEVDKSYTLPLVLKTGQNHLLKVTPSKLDAANKTGLELKENVRKPSIAYISGKFDNWKYGNNITIQRVVDGTYETINSTSNSKEISFLLPCLVKQEGFYYISSLRWKFRVYLKPVDNLELAIDGPSGYYEVIKGSEENQLVQKWQELIRPITDYGYNQQMIRIDSFDLNRYQQAYENIESSITNFRNSINYSGSGFSKLFRMAIDVDKELAPILFLFNSTSRKTNGFSSTPKNFTSVPDFYQRFIKPGKFNDASILSIGEARRYMNLYAKLVIATLPEDQRKQLTQAERVERMIKTMSNDTLKSYMLMDQMFEIDVNNLTEFRATFEPFKKYTGPATVKRKYQAKYQEFIGDTAFIGKSSYNFTLPDSTGRIYSMKDFKGKVVFIDVWATWCGPCKEEYPHIKALEEEYSNNKDIVFLGVSIDMATARKQWVNAIKKEGLPGLQLLDDRGKAFALKYGITGIPRFLLIDRDGKWIEVRCPRPSSKEELKKYLDKALGQGTVSVK